jgi:hypothetical protein
MPKSSSTDREFLELKSGQWRVNVAVPRHLQHRLGTRLRAYLGTDSLKVANILKWPKVAEFKARIAEAERAATRDPHIRDAIDLAETRVKSGADHQNLRYELQVRAEVIERRHGPEKARSFASIARGEEVPLMLHHASHVAGIVAAEGTKADSRRTVKALADWCAKRGIPATLQAIDRKTATRFLDELPAFTGGLSASTLRKYLDRLRIFWDWLEKREHIDRNVWQGLRLPQPRTPHDEKERPFTAEEMVALLTGPADRAMHDLMRIGALCGARIDAIVSLDVGDCADGLFVFKPQKKEDKPRAVPIHSQLAEIIERRTAGKPKDAPLFPEWPGGKGAYRAKRPSLLFTDYRRRIGVDETVQGKRRALTNFHSFRRWFITEAERADQPPHIIQVVVGHKRQGMTLGVYSAGPLLEQALRCVEAVKLPNLEKVET